MTDRGMTGVGHADPASATAILTIDLAAIAANYRLLAERTRPAECAAVVKADAYGLAAKQVIPALAKAGCRTFFVATPDEGIAARAILGPRKGDIYVLDGALPGGEDTFLAHGLRPVLNSLGDVERWRNGIKGTANAPGAALHLDTGMARLGLPPDELARLAAEPERLEGARLALVMSHLACADQPDHPLNAQQRDAFGAARGRLPSLPASLANSSGIFLGTAYHHQRVRPGIALYGGNPQPATANPMHQVVRLQGRILQVREIDRPQTVGYGATHRAERRERIATVGVGYADGFLRALGNRGMGYIGAHGVPLVGRVSMDLITFDVTAVPENAAHPGALIDLIGPHNPIDRVADAAGTISYEVLTRLGPRFARVYRGGADG